MTKRKAITDRMKWQSALYWGGVKCHECDLVMLPNEELEWDHAHALVFGGPHDYGNIRPMHATCHTQKTIRDVKALAKTKRLEKKRMGVAPKPKKRIPSRPFQKRRAA